jgi:hypothetical protein
VAAEVVATVETIRAIVADQVADQVTMRPRHHLVQAHQARAIMAAAALQIQAHIQVAAVVVLAVLAQLGLVLLPATAELEHHILFLEH